MIFEIPLPDRLLSEKGKAIYDNLWIPEKIYCKYFFLDNTEYVSVLLGIGYATVVNNVTSALGISYKNIQSLLIYLISIILSVFVFRSILKLYHHAVTSIKMVSEGDSVPSSRITEQLEYYEKNREDIARHLYFFIVYGIIYLIYVIDFCVYNHFH